MVTIIYSNPFPLTYSNRGHFTDNINWYSANAFDYASSQINETLIPPNFEGSVQYYGQIPFGNTNSNLYNYIIDVLDDNSKIFYFDLNNDNNLVNDLIETAYLDTFTVKYIDGTTEPFKFYYHYYGDNRINYTRTCGRGGYINIDNQDIEILVLDNNSNAIYDINDSFIIDLNLDGELNGWFSSTPYFDFKSWGNYSTTEKISGPGPIPFNNKYYEISSITPNGRLIEINEVSLQVADCDTITGPIPLTIECDDVGGCMDETALNYNPGASVDDGSCAVDSGEYNSLLIGNWVMVAGLTWDACSEHDEGIGDPDTLKFEESVLSDFSIPINFINQGIGTWSTFSVFDSSIELVEIDINWWTQQDSLGIISLDSLSSLSTPFFLTYSFSDENNVLILKDNKPFLVGCAEIHFNRVIEMSLYNSIVPGKYGISSIYPNPFNPITTISFSIPELGLTNITSYDITGRQLETLTNEVLSVGNYSINWNASSYPSGVYLIRMDSGDFTQTQKVVFVK